MSYSTNTREHNDITSNLFMRNDKHGSRPNHCHGERARQERQQMTEYTITTLVDDDTDFNKLEKTFIKATELIGTFNKHLLFEKHRPGYAKLINVDYSTDTTDVGSMYISLTFAIYDEQTLIDLANYGPLEACIKSLGMKVAYD